MTRPTWTRDSFITASFLGEEDPEKLKSLRARLKKHYSGMDTHNREIFLKRVILRWEDRPEVYPQLQEVVQEVAQEELKQIPVRKRYLGLVDVNSNGVIRVQVLCHPDDRPELLRIEEEKGFFCDNWTVGDDEDSYGWVTRLRDDDHGVPVDNSGKEVIR